MKNIKEYLSNILIENEEKKNREWNILIRSGNLPVLNKNGEMLPELQESIVKIIYLSNGGMFWADLKRLFAFFAEESRLLRAVRSLLCQGYLQEEENCYGKIFGLTKDAIAQVRGATKEEKANISPMNLKTESSLSKKKLVSAKIADYVFERQVIWLWNSFFTTDKQKRNEYLVDLYLTQILFRDIKECSKEEQKIRFVQAGIDELIATEMSETEKYMVGQARHFMECYLLKHDREEIKKTEEYRSFLNHIRSIGLKGYPNINTFYLLKDFPFRQERTPYQELSLVLNWKCNITKFGMDRIRERQAGERAKNALLQQEYELEKLSRCIKAYTTVKRNLINTNAYKNKEDTFLLEEITKKIKALDFMLEELHKQKEELETGFNFRILKSYDEDGENYEDKVITFGRLLPSGIFFEECSSADKKQIRFYITQQQDDVFDLFSLHKKVSMVYFLARKLYEVPVYEFTIEILVHNEEQKSFIESKRNTLRKKLLANRETAVCGNLLDDTLKIKILKGTIEERYLFFHRVYDEWKKQKGKIKIC